MINFVKIARVLISILFVFSGISKLISLSFFDGLVAELLIGPDYFDYPSKFIGTQIFTRVLISIELTLGVAILQNWNIRKLILPAIQGMLLVFTIHLFYEGFKNGFGGNCGCFGDVLPMSNTESIIKNIVAMLLGVYVWKKYMKDHMRSHFPSWVPGLIIGAVTLATLMFGIKDITPNVVEVNTTEIDSTETSSITPIDTTAKILSLIDSLEHKVVDTPKDTIKKKVEPKIKEPLTVLSPKDEKTIQLLEKYKKFTNSKTPNFRKGRKIVGMFSMTCSHCQEVIHDFCMIGQEGKLPTQYLYNFGTKLEQNYFFAQAMGCDYPYVRMEDYSEFKRLLEGNDFPRILVIEDGKIVKEWNVKTYSNQAFRDYFNIQKKVEKVDPLNPGKKSGEEEEDNLPTTPW